MAEYWFTDTETLRAFGTILNTAGIFEGSEDFQSFLDEPFQYNDAYNAWVAADSPDEGDENWDDFVEAISDDESEEDGNE